MAPKVSVVTPIYNVADYLSQCLRSLAAQTLEDIEFICVNDGSTDDSLEILKSFAENDPRFVIIDKPNGGYGHSMNKGIEAARGKYIGIVESDDFIEPNAFEVLYGLASHNGHCDIVKANHYVHCKGADPAVVENFPPEICGRVLSPLDEDGQAVLNSIPAIWSAIYRRDFLNDNDIRFLETPGAAFQDTGFVFKTWIAADSFYLTNEAYLHYRIDNEGSSVKSPAKALYVCDEFKSVEEFLERFPEKKKALEGRLTAKKFDTYCWNYDRIAVEFRKDFLALTSAEFALALKEGKIDPRYYTPEEWERLMAIIDDPNAVFAKDLEMATAVSKSELVRAIPIRIRDGLEKAAVGAKRMIPITSRKHTGPAAEKVVSVVIPVYNAEPFLDKLFDSLLSQTHENLQIICVEDGSSDGSLEKLESYAAQDGRIEVISSGNAGAGGARNIGIDKATGDYLCFVDADDYIEDNAIELLVDIAEAENLDVALFGIDEYEDDTHRHQRMYHAAVKGKVPYNTVFRPRDVDNFFVNMTGFTVNKLYRLSYLKNLNVKFPSIGAHEDMPFTYAAVTPAERAYYLDKVLYHYRLEREGSRSDSTEKQFIFMLQALECMQNELEQLGIWDECERDFINYVVSMCRWKFSSLHGRYRRKFYDALFEDGWLERFGVPGHSSSFFFSPYDRKFYLLLFTKSFDELIEDENDWYADELDEVLNSKTFRLGNLFAEPTRRVRRALGVGIDEAESGE